MPYTAAMLPFATSDSPIAQTCSLHGAEEATARSATQTIRLLELYAKRGATSDAEAALILGWMRSTVNARRGPLKKRGIVVAIDKHTNPDTGICNTRWGLKGSR